MQPREQRGFNLLFLRRGYLMALRWCLRTGFGSVVKRAPIIENPYEIRGLSLCGILLLNCSLGFV